ncbi:MAG: esterase [Balneola sp.]|nr:esterase [Balneola sp.]|tara:strand:- start:64542 stop:65702 length:1161 start_codon:yes stop_codon:yes gene_type:complete
MKKHISLWTILLVVSTSLSMAQNTEYKPSSANQAGKEYPMVNEKGQVKAKIFAPDANYVQLDIGAVKYDLEKDEEGYWVGESAPQDEGFHYYQLNIDGASVPDPGSKYFYGAGRWGSGVEVPAHDQEIYALKDVPHGTVSEHVFYSEISESFKRTFVYTPPGYETNTDQSYPVLYLQHGGGENETGWSNQGKANLIMDNLIAAGESEPFIIVMSDGNWAFRPPANNDDDAEEDDAPREWPPRGWADGFMNTLIQEIIPMIDSNYRTIADQDHRAMAGLSMGGMQTRVITLQNSDVFSHVGMFSGGSISPKDVENNPDFKENIDLLFVSYGSKELDGNGRFGDPRANTNKLGEMGMNTHFYVSPETAHEWQSWRRSLYEFAPLLFRN